MMTVSVCLSVRLPVCPRAYPRTTRPILIKFLMKFTYVMSVARSTSDGVAIN